MSINTAPCNGTQLQDSSQGPFVSTNALFNDSTSSNCSLHKSFDFSNINVTSSGYGQIKQFHQTRIYVKNFKGMTTNGNTIGGEGSTYIISSNLPDSFSYGIGSEWGSPLSDVFKGVGNLILQFGSAAAKQSSNADIRNIGSKFASGINRAANFLIWSGAKPLEIQLKIPVIDDNSYQSECGTVKTDLKEALEFLGCLCLPTIEKNGYGFYTPAPSPLELKLITSRDTDEKGNVTENSFTMSPNKARIMVQIGGMLFIDNCIIKSVDVNYPNTKGLMLRNDGSLTPILAEVTIHITTIETLTSGTYTKMLWRKEQSDQGKATADIDSILQGAKAIKDGVYDRYLKPFDFRTPDAEQNGQAEIK